MLSIFIPAVLEPLDQIQRTLKCVTILSFLFCISSVWAVYLDRITENNRVLHTVAQIALTNICTTAFATGYSMMVRFFAVTDKYPSLTSRRFGRMVPGLAVTFVTMGFVAFVLFVVFRLTGFFLRLTCV